MVYLDIVFLMKKQLLMNKTKLFLLGCLLAMNSHSVFAQNGLNFDPAGTPDYVQTTFNGVLGSADRTFEAWIYLTSAPTANVAISDYGLNAAGSRNTFYINSSLGLGFISGGTNANISSTTNVVPVNQWVHVAFVMNSSTGFLYVNGSQVGTGSLTTVNTPSGNVNLRIGQRVSAGSIPFNGVIDEFRVWNLARTQQEISSNMNGELCGTPVGLVAYYKLNEGIAGGANTTVTTAVDEVAGANGTLLNFALSGATSNWVTGATLTQAFVTNNLTLNECAGFSITIDGNTYNTTGNYSDTLVGASINGCDSIVNTDLTIAAAIDTMVTNTSPTLTANQTGASYQWIDCDNGNSPILGDTNQSFTATVNGNYAVIIEQDGCVDTSACHAVNNISNIGLLENTFGSNFKLFPNPSDGQLEIDLGKLYDDVTVIVRNTLGQIISKDTFELSEKIQLHINGNDGLYFVEIQTKKGQSTQLKVLKE